MQCQPNSIWGLCVQERNQLSIQLTNLQVDFDNVNARLEEETENAASLLLARTEELEEIRLLFCLTCNFVITSLDNVDRF